MKTKAKPQVYTLFSELLARGRKREGIPQTLVAEKAGVDVRTVKRWERGMSIPCNRVLDVLVHLHVLSGGDTIRLHRVRLGLLPEPCKGDRVSDLLT